MASPVVVYFAGIGTVVAALGIGFGAALLLTSTTPVQKEPPAGFAKRDQPVAESRVLPQVVAAPAQVMEPYNPADGLAPPITAPPIPAAEAVSRALALNPPPAVADPVRPTPPQSAEPQKAAAPDEVSAATSKDTAKRKDAAAPDKKPDQKVTAPKRRIVVADKEKPAEEEEERSEPSSASEVREPDRATRSGF